jgi:hypothetical protein
MGSLLSWRLALAPLLLLFNDFAIAQADPEQCKYAIEQYNSAIGDISSYLRRYSKCVSDSRGRDDCNSEFRRLKSAQGDLESAVSSYQSYCG